MMKLDFQIAIIGAGFSGLVAAIKLQKAQKNDFVIFEKAHEVGGTWRDNTYPGCACDIPSHLYSFVDEPNPNWSENYSGQPEILAYIKRVVDKRKLNEQIRLGTNITEIRFLEKDGCWILKEEGGKAYHVRMVIFATGPLNRPNIPMFEGFTDFKGKIMHSFQWDHTYSFEGKKVGVIGTGASAIQIVPSLAKLAHHLTVFQRTAAWIVARNNRKVNRLRKFFYNYIPITQYLYRESLYWYCEMGGLGFTGSKFVNTIMHWMGKMKLKKEVKDPHLRQKLTPNYTIGCKRIMRSDDYLPTFNRTNVELETDGIAKFTENGIQTVSGKHHDVDVIILATGFQAADFDTSLNIWGLNDTNLKTHWQASGAEAYLGTTTPLFPNFVVMLGPNTGLGHNSMIHMMESQMNYITEYIALLEKQPQPTYLSLKPIPQTHYNQYLTEAFKGTVWTSGCSSWYFNKDQKPIIIYPGLTYTFRKQTRHLSEEDYDVVRAEV